MASDTALQAAGFNIRGLLAVLLSPGRILDTGVCTAHGVVQMACSVPCKMQRTWAEIWASEQLGSTGYDTGQINHKFYLVMAIVLSSLGLDRDKFSCRGKGRLADEPTSREVCCISVRFSTLADLETGSDGQSAGQGTDWRPA